MEYYKNNQGEIYAYDDDVSDEFLNSKIKELGLKKLSMEEIEELNTPKELTQDELLAKAEIDFKAAMDRVMNEAAQAKGYDNIVTACSYAARAGYFQAEGIAFYDWRDSVWAWGYQLLREIKAGKRAIPTIAEAIEMMPTLVLPTQASTQEA